MELVPVGVGAAYGLPHEGQSCYLVRTPERAVVLDLGSGTLNRLCALMAPQDLDAVVISHLHPDHCADLMSLRVYMLWGPGAGGRLRLMGPPGLRERLTAFSGSEGWDDAFSFEELSRPGGRVDLGGGLVLRYHEVPHLPPTFAMRLEWGGAALCYGADCAPGRSSPSWPPGAGCWCARRRSGPSRCPRACPTCRPGRPGASPPRRGWAACCSPTARRNSTATPPSRPRGPSSPARSTGPGRGSR